MRWRAIPMALVCALALASADHAAPSAAEAPAQATRLVAPPDGQAYFGFTFRLFDTSEPIWGDTRLLAERIHDSIQNELAGKTPAFIKVWTPWQHPDLPGKPLVPFADALGDVSKGR